MKSYPTKFKSLLWKIVQMGTSQKLQNSIQTLIIFWPVYPIHTNSLFWVIFLELPFCHFPPPNASIRGKDSKIQLIFHLNILDFQTNGKQLYSFPVLSRFCNGLYDIVPYAQHSLPVRFFPKYYFNKLCIQLSLPIVDRSITPVISTSIGTIGVRFKRAW